MGEILDILILTLDSRCLQFNRLFDILEPQLVHGVKIMAYNNPDATIGANRQTLLEQATADYVCFIDDDDTVAPCYVNKILCALDTEPDVVGIKGITVPTNCVWEQSIYNYHWARDGKKRPPTHLNPVKRTLALKAGYKPVNNGEDVLYSKDLLPYLHTEEFIHEILYFYEPSSEPKTGYIYDARSDTFKWV